MTVLVINGTAGNDDIFISGVGGAPLHVGVNGINTTYNPNNYTGIVVNGIGGNDTFNILSTELPVTVNGAGADTVLLGDTTGVQDITAPVNITDPPSFANVTIDDSVDTVGRSATISDTSITGLAPATISYQPGDLSSLTVNGGSGGNTFTVTNTPEAAGTTPTNLNSGTGVDQVNIQGTALDSVLNVQGENGGDSVSVGNVGSVQGIQGPVNIENANQFDALTIDDSADASPRTVTLSSFTPGSDSPWESVSGLAPAPINYEVADVTPATINAGSGGNIFNVNSLADGAGLTNLNTGTGADQVNIRTTDAGTTLEVDGQSGGDTVNIGNAGSVQGIQGMLNIENTNSFDALTIDDSADATPRTATLSTVTPTGDSAWESLTGLAPGPINYELADISTATINGGSGGNTFNVNLGSGALQMNLNTGTGADQVNVLATAGSSTLDLQGESGGDIVNVGNAGSVQGIQGAVNIENNFSYDTLTIDDSADTSPRTVTLNTSMPAGDTPWESLTGLAPGTISYEGEDVGTATIDGGSGGNTFNVNGIVGGAFPTTNLNTGLGADQVNILATGTGTTLNVQGQNGVDTVNVGNAGSVQGILGAVNIENALGFDTLTIDDSADATARTATLSTFTPVGDSPWEGLTGLAPGTINLEVADMRSTTIKLGNGGNTFSIDSTAAGGFNVLTIDGGAGNDVFNIYATASQTILSINYGGGQDTINLDFTSGNPLPNQVNLSGDFTINGFASGDNLNNTTLNIGASTIYFNYVNPVLDPIALIRSYIKTGYNGGAWNGAATASTGAINSSVAAMNSGYMIGYADWADGVVAGQPANTVELKYTLGGDLDLSGTVNFADFAKVVADYGKPASWDGGAISYGATVSFADFALTVANYGKKTVTPLAEAMYAASSVVGSAVAAMGDWDDPSKIK